MERLFYLNSIETRNQSTYMLRLLKYIHMVGDKDRYSND